MFTGKKIKDFNESPLLTERVKKQKLPPVEERLPQNPLVLEPWEDIGVYGGVLRYSEIHPKFCHYLRHINEAALLELGPSNKYHHYSRIEGPVRPGIFEKWESDEEGVIY